MRKRRNGFHHGFDSIVESLILHGCHPLPRCCFSKTPPKPTFSLPHNLASSNRLWRLVVINWDHKEISERSARFDDRLGEIKERLHWNTLVAAVKRVGQVDIGVACDAEWRRVPPRQPCTRRTLELACKPRTSTHWSFALCFNFLSFDFFGANKRGREWMGGEEERATSRYWKYLSEESSMGPTKRLKYLSDVNWKNVLNGWV